MYQERALLCKAMAHPSRVEILDQLYAYPMSTGAFAELLEVSLPTAARHLEVLLDAGLVRYQKVGANTVWHLVTGQCDELIEWLALVNYKIL